MFSVIKPLGIALIMIALGSARGLDISGTQRDTYSANNHIDVVVLGRVIGVEQPSFYHPPYGEVNILYLKIEKVIKGQEISRYLRIAYGYYREGAAILEEGQINPILPGAMFNGRSLWVFQLHRQPDFDKAVELSRKPRDWVEEEGRVEGNIVIFARTRPKCVPTLGNEAEALLMEKEGELKGYLLEEKRYEKAK